MTREAVTTGPKGRTATSSDPWKRDGNAVTREGTVKSSGGGILQRSSATVREVGKTQRGAMRGIQRPVKE